jgi:hypothetical protein
MGCIVYIRMATVEATTSVPHSKAVGYGEYRDSGNFASRAFVGWKSHAVPLRGKFGALEEFAG